MENVINKLIKNPPISITLIMVLVIFLHLSLFQIMNYKKNNKIIIPAIQIEFLKSNASINSKTVVEKNKIKTSLKPLQKPLTQTQNINPIVKEVKAIKNTFLTTKQSASKIEISSNVTQPIIEYSEIQKPLPINSKINIDNLNKTPNSISNANHTKSDNKEENSNENGISQKASFLGGIPNYPIESRENEEEGTVILKVLVAANGKAKQVSILKSSGFLRLDNAAKNHVLNSVFRAKLKNGESIEEWVELPIKFRLS